jgi:HrpA-like RNA helicase
VELFYTEVAEQSYIDAALMTVLQIHAKEKPGDVLVFLTGQDEIESMKQLITERWSGNSHLCSV